MPARTAACRRRFRRREWSAWSLVAARRRSRILMAAWEAMQGRFRRAALCTGGARGGSRAPAAARLLLHFQRVFHGVEGGELYIVQLAVDLFDLADIDVLDDVARLRINGNRPARAFPFPSLHRGDHGGAVGLALSLLERLVDEVHAVVAAERDEVRAVAVGLLEGGDILLVGRRIVHDGIDAGSDDAEHGIAHSGKIIIVDDVAGPGELDAGFVEAALSELLGERSGLP